MTLIVRNNGVTAETSVIVMVMASGVTVMSADTSVTVMLVDSDVKWTVV